MLRVVIHIYNWETEARGSQIEIQPGNLVIQKNAVLTVKIKKKMGVGT